MKKFFSIVVAMLFAATIALAAEETVQTPGKEAGKAEVKKEEVKKGNTKKKVTKKAVSKKKVVKKKDEKAAEKTETAK